MLTGTRDYQPSETQNVNIRLQTTCAGNPDGTSIVFATTVKENSRLQRMKQTTSAGIGPATLTYPSRADRQDIRVTTPRSARIEWI